MDPDIGSRTNEEWLAALRGGGEPGRAAKDLGLYLRNGIAKALSSKTGVDPADLDDFTQDAVIRILQKLDTFRGDSRFTTWAVAVGVRVAFTALRRRRWNNRPLEDLELGEVAPRSAGCSAEAPNPDRVAERNDLLEALRYAIDHALTNRQRTVILAELAQVPSMDIAQQLGTNRNALYKLCHDARKRLRRALEEAGFSVEDVRQLLAKGSQVR